MSKASGFPPSSFPPSGFPPSGLAGGELGGGETQGQQVCGPSGPRQPWQDASPVQRAPTVPFLSPGAVGPLSRQLVERVVGRDPSVHSWRAGGPLLPGAPPPGELARRLSETDLAFLTEGELEAFLHACGILHHWLSARARAARSELAARALTRQDEA